RVMPSSGSNDPLDEIERLIAETTSIDFPAPPPLPRAAPSQAVRAEMAAKPAAADEPLRARPHLDDAAEAAEAAIRASVTASTATVEAADRPGARAAAFAMTIGLGRFIVPATAALVVLVLAGGGAYWYFTQVGEPPVVTAQTASVKEPAPAIDAANDSIVFSQLGDSAAKTPDTEQIVSRDETAGESGEDLARVITPESDTGGLANRKVRTVTVRADGTIVSGDEATAGVEPLPALRPNVPDVPGAPAIEDGDADAIGDVLNALAEEEQAPGETTAPVDPQASALLATDEPVATGVGNVAPIPIPRPNNLAAPTTTTQPATQPAATPIPQPVPTGQPVNIAVIEPAPVADVSGEPVPLMAGANPAVPTQTASLTATPIASASSAPYYVQLSSQRSETAARSTVDEIRRLYGNIIGSTRLEIQLVDLGDRGVFYRVKAPAASAAAATALCNQIKVAGGDCFVRAD
ncbi:MAG: SPOR domain-containing protein, partial [Cucumibacter sp.]